MPGDDHEHWNRDDEQKPGAPPRSAHEPKGSEGSTRSGKTHTDPASGAPAADRPAPNRSQHDDQRRR